MKTLLVQPPLTMSPEVQPPLGLCVLAAHLRRYGHAISILDLDLEEKSASHSPDHYLETFEAALREQRPQVVGFTSMFNNSLHAERLIRATKTVDCSIITVAGGSHFGALPQESLHRIAELDFAICGEGEGALSNLLSALQDGTTVEQTPGLCYRTPHGIQENPAGPLLELNDVQPTWNSLDGILDLRRYVTTIPNDSPRKTIYIEAGRGCPFACSFCATAPFWQRRYRVKAIDSIVAEMRYLYEQYQYDTFMLVHDLLTVDRHFVSDFCDALFAARLPVEWTANHRADLKLGPLAPKMRSAGCSSVFMGIESASDRIQKEVHKGLTREQIMSTVHSLREVGIASTCSFIIGFPSETAADVSATIELAGRLKMIGAEPVQVHRLRRWPPAPLAALDLQASFDLEALRLEYPADAIPEGDIALLESDPDFFIGYFTPASVAGSAFQLAQLELLFANMLAMFPITVAALAAVYRDRLVDAYYGTLAEQGPISRAELHSAMSVQGALVPYLSTWIAHDERLKAWERSLLQGILSYEKNRIEFMAVRDGAAHAVASGPNWIVFTTAIDVVEVLRRLAEGLDLTSDLVRNGYVALSRSDNGAVSGYAIGERLVDRLLQGDPAVFSMLESSAAP